MAMRLAMAFDHYNAAWGSSTVTNSQYSDYPWSVSSQNTGGTSYLAKIGNYNWLQLVANTANTAVQAIFYYLKFSDIWDITKPRSYCGFRVQVGPAPGKTYLQPNYSYASLTYGTAVGIPSSGIYKLFDVGDIPSLAQGVEYYVELMIDWVNLTRTVWVDGNMITNAQPLGFTPVAAGGIQFNVSTNASSLTTYGGFMALTHMYFLDDSGDGAPDSQRLGPGIMTLCPVKDAAGAGWTRSDNGDFVTELNSPIAQTANATPNLISAADGTALDMHFDVSKLDPIAPVKFVLPILSTGRAAAGAASTKAVVSDQATPANTKRLADVNFSNANMLYSRKLGILTKNLDGTPLSLDQLSKLKLSVSSITPGS